MNAGRRTVQYEESTSVRRRSAIPIAAMSGPAVMNPRDPNRSDRRPTFGATTSITAEKANIRIPAPSGEYPRTFWRYSARKNTVPNMAKKIDAATALDAANVGIRKKCSGSIGDCRRDSIRRNAPSSTAATANAPRISPSVHPRALPSMSA
jgi:hypothetical protein